MPALFGKRARRLRALLRTNSGNATGIRRTRTTRTRTKPMIGPAGLMLCANCGEPVALHCGTHLIPCCPDRCTEPDPFMDERRELLALLAFNTELTDDEWEIINLRWTELNVPGKARPAIRFTGPARWIHVAVECPDCHTLCITRGIHFTLTDGPRRPAMLPGFNPPTPERLLLATHHATDCPALRWRIHRIIRRWHR